MSLSRDRSVYCRKVLSTQITKKTRTWKMAVKQNYSHREWRVGCRRLSQTKKAQILPFATKTYLRNYEPWLETEWLSPV